MGEGSFLNRCLRASKGFVRGDKKPFSIQFSDCWDCKYQLSVGKRHSGLKGREVNESCSVVSGSLQPRGLYSSEYWNAEPFPSPGDLPDPGIEPRSPALQADSLPAEPPGSHSGLELSKGELGSSGPRRLPLTGGVQAAARGPSRLKWGGLGLSSNLQLQPVLCFALWLTGREQDHFLGSGNFFFNF